MIKIGDDYYYANSKGQLIVNQTYYCSRMNGLMEEGTYETNRLRRLFSAFECVAELNADLLKSTVSEVLVTRQNVKLRLKNGQVIERSDLQ